MLLVVVYSWPWCSMQSGIVCKKSGEESEKSGMAGAKITQVPGFKLYIMDISHNYENRRYNL